MFENIINFFKKLGKKEKKESFLSQVYKEMKLVHFPNRKDMIKYSVATICFVIFFDVSADFLELMRQESIEVIKKYIDIDEKAIDVKLTNKTNEDGTVGAPALYANIPIITIKNDARKLNIEKPSEKDKEASNNSVETSKNDEKPSESKEEAPKENGKSSENKEEAPKEAEKPSESKEKAPKNDEKPSESKEETPKNDEKTSENKKELSKDNTKPLTTDSKETENLEEPANSEETVKEAKENKEESQNKEEQKEN